MINFRFHLVSVTAIFLALGAGIAIGAGVVDRASVNFLENQLAAVEARRQATNTRNEELAANLEAWQRFGEQASRQLVDGQLVDADGPVPVLLVSVRGVAAQPVERLQDAVQAAGGDLQGTVWLTRKWELESPASVAEVAQLVGADEEAPAAREQALLLLADALSGAPGGAATLNGLRDVALVEFEPGPAGVPLDSVPAITARLVVVSGEGAEVADGLLAAPLIEALAERNRPVLAAQPGTPTGDEPFDFIGLLRRDGDVAARISTVDSLADHRGLIAAVLAIDVLGSGRAGHYGLGPGADRIVPEPGP